jgi:adenylosuccinate lyase
LSRDKEIRKFLSRAELDEIFNLKYYLKNIDYIYERVFGRTGSRKKK